MADRKAPFSKPQKPSCSPRTVKGVYQPLVVAYGLGLDSTAMLIGMHRAGIRPDLILFADVAGAQPTPKGELRLGEKPETYEYLPVIQRWLKKVGFPPVVTVAFKQTENVDYSSLYEYSVQKQWFPGVAYGSRRSCSEKFKIGPQNEYVNKWEPARKAWAAGLKVFKAIGYDATEERRSDIAEDKKYIYCYPLQEWGWGRDDLAIVVRSENLPVPGKSACFFCPSQKPHELVKLSKKSPQLGEAIKEMERVVRAGPHMKPEDPVQGLWRGGTKGERGAEAKPAQMTEFLEELKVGPYVESEWVHTDELVNYELSLTPSQAATFHKTYDELRPKTGARTAFNMGKLAVEGIKLTPAERKLFMDTFKDLRSASSEAKAFETAKLVVTSSR